MDSQSLGGFSAPDSSPSNRWEHPPSFYCPISQQCMHDPVVLSDGHSYERRYIERWLESHNSSPVTAAQLSQKVVFPNHALRNAIEEYFQQVFSVHRRAIRKTIKAPGTDSLDSNTALLRTIDALMQCSLLVNADLTTECVIRQIMDEAKTLLGAEVASVWLVDEATQELYSNVNSNGNELRIPITAGIAGHVATTGEVVIVEDAYNDARFNSTMDKKTGFKTSNMICAPLKMKRGEILGVVQLINKVKVSSVSSEDRFGVMGRMEGEAGSFTPDDIHFLQVFANQAAIAVSNSGVSESELPRRSSKSESSMPGQEPEDDEPTKPALQGEPVTKKKSGRARQRAAKFWRSVRCRTPSPEGFWESRR